MIRVFFLPSLAAPDAFRDRTVVVIDVLRATTTIAQALAAGAASVLPCREVGDALRYKAELGDQAVTGGERQGRRIDGFDLGNSPSEYTSHTVGGKTVVFTTTNGTRAIGVCQNARHILLAAFVNLSAVCQRLAELPEFDILCAGTDGQISREDVLLAGALIADRQLLERPGDTFNDQAEIAADVWRRVARESLGHQPVWRILRSSHGGRHLLDLGHDEDIELAAQLDRLEVLPQLAPPASQITDALRT